MSELGISSLASSMRTTFLLSGLLLLGGCVGFSKDGGFGDVKEVARQKLGADAQWARTAEEGTTLKEEVGKKLANELSPDDAVQIALWNNPGLQASYAELRLTEADLVAASRLPGLRLSRLRVSHPDIGPKIEEFIGFNLLYLVTIPSRVSAERARFDQVKANMAAEMLRVAFETRKAYYEAIAAQQTFIYLGDVREAAEASAELARRMTSVGNFSKLNQLREQAFYADAQSQYARGYAQSVASREKLTRMLGLAGPEIAYKLPRKLPDLPAQPDELKDAESVAMRERLDVRAAKAQSDALAKTLGLTKVTRFVNAIDVSRARIREGFDPARKGWDIGIEIPLFDFGSARTAQAEASYMQSVSQIAQTAVNAQSEVREAYQVYRTSYDLAKHYREEVLPLRKKVSDEVQLRYNGMLASVFELLADAREQIAAVNQTIAAQRDFWIAESDLRMAMTGKPTGIASLKPMTDSAEPGR